jgi:NADH-quinone oxidoreductase subunit N
MILSIHYSSIVSEILLIIAILLLLLVDLFLNDKERKVTFILTLLVLLTLLFMDTQRFSMSPVITFNQHWILDSLSLFLKSLIYFITIVTLIYARAFIKNKSLMRGEYYILTLFSVLGSMVLVSSNSFLMSYLGIEMLFLSLYILIAMDRDEKMTSESAIRYFILGSIGTGFFLYGISFIYGSTQSIIFSEISHQLPSHINKSFFQWGVFFVLIGLVSKLGMAPFHISLPLIHQGASSPMNLYILTVSKVALFGLFIRLYIDIFSLIPLFSKVLFMCLGLLSIIVGHISALLEKQLKRMLGYSSMANIGYCMVAISIGNTHAYSGALFYLFIYVLITLACFGSIIFLSSDSKDDHHIDILKGLGQYHPWYAFMFLLAFISMAGVPPFIGFWPKMELLTLLIRHDYIFVSILVTMLSMIALVTYLRMIKIMYFVNVDNSPPMTKSRSLKVLLGIHCLLLFVFGLSPNSLYQYCLSVF